MHVVNKICNFISSLHENYVKDKVTEMHNSLFLKMLGGV
jgi:hypothetical protein